jgi:predicted transcriptional regulator
VSLPGLGPLESAVMDVMWRAREPITGRTCLNRLDYQTCYGEAPSYKAVMLILANLGKKRLLTRVTLAQDGHPGGPAWKYQVQISREDYLAAVIREALACAPDQSPVLAAVLAGLPLDPS